MTTVDGIRPPLPGVRVQAIDLGTKIELRNHSRRVVTVIGYQGEPYLRVGPRGVWQNDRSPAVFLNRSQIPTQEAPGDEYDAKAKPHWVKISDTPVATWHDHRTHLMTSEDPQSVQRDPGRRRVVIASWRIPLRDEARRYAVVGDATYIPPPSPWPWIIGAVMLVAGTVVLCRTRRWSAVMQVALDDPRGERDDPRRRRLAGVDRIDRQPPAREHLLHRRDRGVRARTVVAAAP